MASIDAMTAIRAELPALRDDLRTGWFTTASDGPTLRGFYDPHHDPDILWLSTDMPAEHVGWVLKHETGHVVQHFFFGVVGDEALCDQYADGDRDALATLRAFSNTHPAKVPAATRKP
jgi:hypothetical protein